MRVNVMRGSWRWLGGIAAMLLATAMVGCSDETTNVGDDCCGTFTVRLMGRVVDQGTGLGIRGATVNVCGWGTARTDAAGAWIYDIDGMPIGIVDGGMGVVIRIDAVGFASRDLQADVSEALGDIPPEAFEILKNATVMVYVSDEGAEAEMVGDSDVPWELEQAFVSMTSAQSLTVVVTKDGNPIGKDVVVFAYYDDSTGPCRTVLQAKTDDDGIATLAGLDPRFEYEIFVPPQDLEAPTGYDFYSEPIEHSIVADGNIEAYNVWSAVGDPSTSIVTTDLGHVSSYEFITGPIGATSTQNLSPEANFGEDPYEDASRDLPASDVDESVSFSYVLLGGGNGKVRVVFEDPVVILGGSADLEPRFEYRRNLENPFGTAYQPVGDTTEISLTTIGATASDVLAGTAGAGVIWDFTATSTLPANEVFKLHFFWREAQGSDANNKTYTFYRPAAAAVGAPTLDNYNGATGDTTDEVVYLEFSEVVTGYYKVLEYEDGPNRYLIQGGTARQIGDGDSYDSMVQNVASANLVSNPVNQLGVGVGNFYRTELRVTGTTDDGTVRSNYQLELEDGMEVKILISVRDLDGNRFEDILTLTVQ